MLLIIKNSSVFPLKKFLQVFPELCFNRGSYFSFVNFLSQLSQYIVLACTLLTQSLCMLLTVLPGCCECPASTSCFQCLGNLLQSQQQAGEAQFQAFYLIKCQLPVNLARFLPNFFIFLLRNQVKTQDMYSFDKSFLNMPVNLKLCQRLKITQLLYRLFAVKILPRDT